LDEGEGIAKEINKNTIEEEKRWKDLEEGARLQAVETREETTTLEQRGSKAGLKKPKKSADLRELLRVRDKTDRENKHIRHDVEKERRGMQVGKSKLQPGGLFAENKTER